MISLCCMLLFYHCDFMDLHVLYSPSYFIYISLQLLAASVLIKSSYCVVLYSSCQNEVQRDNNTTNTYSRLITKEIYFDSASSIAELCESMCVTVYGLTATTVCVCMCRAYSTECTSCSFRIPS